jgi:Lipid A 3-O-deacylase (PagL)
LRKIPGFLLVAAALAPSALSAQGERSIGFVATQSVSSRAAASAPDCCASARDVLAPVSLTTFEMELTFGLGRGGAWGYEYPLRLVPFALARNNPTDSAIRVGTGWGIPEQTPRGPDVGLGVKPLGLRGWAGGGAVRVEGQVSAGVLFFASPILARNATHLNFVAEADLGVRFRLSDGRDVVVGYRRHHLSNGGLGQVNPGLNSHVVYVGFWLGGPA